VTYVESFSVYVLGFAEFRKRCCPVGTSLCTACVAMFAFWVCHCLKSLFLFSVKSDLAEVVVVFGKFQLLRCVLFIFGCHHEVLVVFCADKPDDFSLFAFLFRHGKPPGRADCRCAEGLL
jgi:hypothetical protein